MTRRRGFTLVELLVVIVIIGTLAGMALMFLPGIAGSAREARGAQQVQQMLQLARQRAQRDQSPRGVRLWYTQMDAAAQQVLVSELEYIEQPDDYTGDPAFTNARNVAGFTPDASNQTAWFDGPDIANGQPADPALWNIQPGDFFRLGQNFVHRVTAVGPDPAASAAIGRPIFSVQLNSPLESRVDLADGPAAPTLPDMRKGYGVVRKPRATGDDKITLPGFDPTTNTPEVCIDLNSNVRFAASSSDWITPTPNPFAGGLAAGTKGFFDIVFGPSGAVIMPRMNTPTIKLWVRSYRANESTVANDDTRYFRGEPGLIAVHTGSGLIGSYPVNPGAPGTGAAYVLIQQ